jgi:pyruvate formate lyase activating enzyme
LKRSRPRPGRGMNRLRVPIARLLNLSLRDYPGKLCSKVYVYGCNFRCPYCPDTDLIFNQKEGSKVLEGDVYDHLYRVRGYVTGLCIGGGEPTLHNGLLGFIYRVKSLGFDVKIDTNGTRPKRIKKLMDERLIDYVSMEIKAPLERYTEVVRSKVDLDSVRQSIRTLRRGGVDHEFTVTMIPGILDGDDLEKIAQNLIGSKRFAVQQLNLHGRHCPELEDMDRYSLNEMKAFRDRVSPYFGSCVLRI